MPWDTGCSASPAPAPGRLFRKAGPIYFFGVDLSGSHIAVREKSHHLINRAALLRDLLSSRLADPMLWAGGFLHLFTSGVGFDGAKAGLDNPFSHPVAEASSRCERFAPFGEQVSR